MTIVLPRRTGWIIAAMLAIFVIAAMPDRARGGPLDPPNPPVSTLPLAEPRIPINELPFAANASGSYFLTRNITMTEAIDGITISSNDVTIDLNGFTLRGLDPTAFAINGIHALEGLWDITIENGTVEGFYSPINLYGTNSSRIDGVTVRSYTGWGIQIGGSSVVQDCIVDGGGTGASSGISVSHRTVVRRCSVLNNIYGGIYGTTYAVIEDNQVIGNDIGDSTAGIYISDNDAVVRDNHLSNTGGRDIMVASGKRAVIIGNVVSDCGSLNLVGGGFDFAPMQGQRNSNITRSQGYCP